MKLPVSTAMTTTTTTAAVKHHPWSHLHLALLRVGGARWRCGLVGRRGMPLCELALGTKQTRPGRYCNRKEQSAPKYGDPTLQNICLFIYKIAQRRKFDIVGSRYLRSKATKEQLKHMVSMNSGRFTSRHFEKPQTTPTTPRPSVI